MIFLCYPKCTTCQKAQKWLDAKGIPYAPRHIKEQNPTVAELRQWHQKSGLPLKKFFNTSGLLYKEKHLKEKLLLLSEDEMLALLAEDGMLVKRPMLIGDDFVLVGFKEADWEKALDMFYTEFGWDVKTGIPTRATLEKFDLGDMADKLEELGLIK